MIINFFSYCVVGLLVLYSFPTRRSSDLRPLLPNDHLPPLPPTHLDPTPGAPGAPWCPPRLADAPPPGSRTKGPERSEEHTSELQSRGHLVCRLLLEKKKTESLTQEQQYK